MILFRLAKLKYIDDLSGQGAFLYGGRWNTPGTHALYMATNSSLAFLEILANVSSVDDFPNELNMLQINLHDRQKDIQYLTPEELPQNWDRIPHQMSLQQFGSSKISDSLAVVFPSVVMRWDYNVVLNPHHKEFENISKTKSIYPFNVDSRIRKLFGR